jgi:peptide/nickel transport system substrate-binding protein
VVAATTVTTGGDTEVGAATQVSEQGDPVEGGEITVGLEAETSSWLPGEGTFNQPGVNVAYAIYDPLMHRTADGDVEPYLAESMEPDADCTEWTLTLRPGVTFHDGTPLDAQALKTIFDEYLTAPGANTAASVDEVTSLDDVDDLTVVYRLVEANAAFPVLLISSPGWPFSPTAAAAAGEDAGANPVGTGPFRFVSWQRDSQLVVEKNEDYWQEGLPHLDRITFRPMPDEDTRLASLQSGDIDVMQSLRQSTVIRARELDGIDNYEHLGSNSGGGTVNTSKPPFDDVRVRRALAHALNQEAIIEVLGGAGVTPPTTQFFSEDSPHYSEEVAGSYPAYDPEKAQELYDEYVDDPERSDGTEGPLNMTAFQSPDIDEQLDILRTTTDIDERKAAVEEIGLIVNENVPNTFSGGTLTVMAAQEQLKNLDGWVFPDGTRGNGAASAQVMWGHAWLAG